MIHNNFSNRMALCWRWFRSVEVLMTRSSVALIGTYQNDKLRVLRTVTGTAGYFPLPVLYFAHTRRYDIRTPNRRRKKDHSYRDGRPPVNKGVLKHLKDKIMERGNSQERDLGLDFLADFS